MKQHGITLLEVLISMAILTVGVLGVASLLPMGKIQLMKTDIADRTGACGRAALREIKIRRILDPNIWASSPAQSNVFFIDPLGCLKIDGVSTTSGSIAGQASLSRINLQTYAGSGSPLTSATAFPYPLTSPESIFIWQDDLAYVMPKDLSGNQQPTNGTRPMPVVDASSGAQQFDGKYSWFVTVWPSASEPVNQRRTYTVAAVVCHRRDFSSAGEVVISNCTCNSPGYGGVGVQFSGTTTLKNNEWALLYSGTQYTWYRAVGVGRDEGANQTRMTLVGPDWNGGTTANLLVVSSVTGVYTETVTLDVDGVWSK